MKKILEEFKTFAMRGNVVDMAVGVIIGSAFGKIVSSIVADVVMPVIGLFIGGVNFTELKLTLKHAATDPNGTIVAPAVTLNYGNFLQATFDFLIVAFAIFMMVKLINSFNQKKAVTPPTPPVVPEDVKLLEEIRDLLKEKQ